MRRATPSAHAVAMREANEPVAAMRPIAYSLQFRGRADPVAAHVLDAAASAPSQALLTTIEEGGVAGRFLPAPGDEAFLRARLVLSDGGAFDEVGTIRFGHGHVLRLRTVGAGRLGASPDARLRHGTAVCEVHGGEGQFEGARGFVTSNFFLSDTGELTDNQLGVIFLSLPVLAANRPSPGLRATSSKEESP